MGLCESTNNNNHSSAKKNKIKSLKEQSTSNNTKKNLYCSPIGTSDYLNNKNMSLSQTQITLGNQSYIHKPKPKPYVYQNNNTNSISYIGINGNSFAKGNSKLNSNSLSISNSYGELIIDNQINPEMKGNQEFKEFFDSNYKDIIASNNDNNINAEEEEVNKGSKKNLNLYHQFKKNKSKK